ncbi:hypothetical protein [Polyangium spumosum]|uniref:Uncharacterized protein n=1 Tax=Polyangium spumosum TaxID=889282 RepID=A0A6N7PJS8_9BACT|nr:hypothetical protein [Polyangium spumosum]MRG90354.1 hypothetical protein [Polyangium spumosum]
MPRRLASLAAVLFGLTLAPPALAAKPKIAFRLEYAPPTPPEGCPDAEELAFMLAGEFGYMVVRTDVSPVVRVEVHRVGRAFEAELWGPDAADGAEAWHGKTDAQGTCRELAYDIAALVRARLGPGAWGHEDPPAHLAAPPEVEVQRPELRPVAPRLPESLSYLLPPALASVVTSPEATDEPPVQVEASLGVAASPYGLPSFGLGGNGMLAVRWKRFALAGDVRGLITPASGIGEPEAPGRASLTTFALLGCATPKMFDVCAVVNASRLNFDLDPSSQLQSADAFSMGFGGRVAARWQFSSRFALVGYAETTGEIRNIVFRVRDPEDPTAPVYYWRSPTVRVVAGVAVSAALFD